MQHGNRSIAAPLETSPAHPSRGARWQQPTQPNASSTNSFQQQPERGARSTLSRTSRSPRSPRERACAGISTPLSSRGRKSKIEKRTCEGQIAKFRNLNSCVTRDTFVFFAAAAVAAWHGPGADGEKSNAACAGWVMRAARGARVSRRARGGSREGDPEQGL